MAAFLVVLINVLFFIQPSIQQTPPVLTNRLHDIEVNVGGSAEFTCLITDIGNWEVRWSLDNTRTLATGYFTVSRLDGDQRSIGLPGVSNATHGQFHISTKYIGGTTYNFTLSVTNIAQQDSIFLISCGYLNENVNTRLSNKVRLIVLAVTSVPTSTVSSTAFVSETNQNRNTEHVEFLTTMLAPTTQPSTNMTNSANNNVLIIIIGAAIGGFMLINLVIAIICIVSCRRIKNPQKEDKVELSTTGNSSGRNSSKTDKYQELNLANTTEFPQYAVVNRPPTKENSLRDHQSAEKPKQYGSQYEDVSNLSHQNSLHKNANEDEEAARISRDRELRRSKNVEGLTYAEVQIGSQNGQATSSDYVKPPEEFTAYAELKIN